jgi:hypothetical protein
MIMVEGRQTEIQSSLIIDLRCSRLLSAVRFLFSDHRITRCPDHPISLRRAAQKSPRLKRVILKERPPLPRLKDLKRRSPLCSPLPASFSQPPTPHRRFVVNKRRTAIRQYCRKAVDGLFSCFLAVESCRIPPVNHWLPPSGRQRAASPCNCHVRSTSRQLIASS